MPSLAEHKSKRVQRIMIVGDPGGGKTTALGHLLEHGQELFIVDFDDGLDPIRKFVKPEFHKNLHYEILVDSMTFDKETGYPRTAYKPKAWRKLISLTREWIDSETGENFGAPESWAENRWLVIDTLSGAGEAAFNFTMDFNQRQGLMRRKKDWGDAIRRVEGIPAQLKGYPINTIMTAHLSRLSADEGEEDSDNKNNSRDGRSNKKRKKPDNLLMRYPATLGQKLPPKIAGYFNIVLQAKRVGTGAGAKRVLLTVPEEDVDIKLPLNTRRPEQAEVPINSLFKIIEEIRGQ